MLKKLVALAGAAFALAGFQAPPAAAPQMQLWRLDCGTVEVGDLDFFSDTYLYVGQKKTLTDSCYLIRHGENYLLWDTGLPGELAGKTVPMGGMTLTVTRTVVDQLRQIGVSPDRVNFVGISHRHDDHIGQAADFPKATLLIGGADFEAVKSGESAARFAPWIRGGGKAEKVQGDRDVFGDGSVVMLSTPGHTPGHHSLLVRLPRTGAVMLTGDLWHFTENVKNRGVPGFNTDRADTLASMDRFDAIARRLKAKVVIQHEPADIAKLPAFPKSAQ
ncbi:MAG: N-acyl homoserine lactone hydrolase [Sphingomonadales bacterium]|jgi:glyoxylase-like metal-dependent hydrolase (beta-lactamase superfamily II)|nr:N-acyl homoserine lactone hydrolase [Sphingomonadales bacterium]